MNNLPAPVLAKPTNDRGGTRREGEARGAPEWMPSFGGVLIAGNLAAGIS